MKRRTTHLTTKDLQRFQGILREKLAELASDIGALEQEATKAQAGDLSHLPIHPADLGTDAFEHDILRVLSANERRLAVEIREALERIEDGTYGTCQATGKPIPGERLEIKPWARYTVEAERRAESGPVG